MPDHESINRLIVEALEKLDVAFKDTLNLSYQAEDELYQIGKLGRAIGLLREFQEPIFNKHPELKPPPPWLGEPEPKLSEEQEKIISNLSEDTVLKIDEALMSYATNQYQKVAKIVSIFMGESPLRLSDVPDLYYAQRIEVLANSGRLEYQGNLKFMRYSEVRVPKT